MISSHAPNQTTPHLPKLQLQNGLPPKAVVGELLVLWVVLLGPHPHPAEKTELARAATSRTKPGGSRRPKKKKESPNLDARKVVSVLWVSSFAVVCVVFRNKKTICFFFTIYLFRVSCCFLVSCCCWVSCLFVVGFPVFCSPVPANTNSDLSKAKPGRLSFWFSHGSLFEVPKGEAIDCTWGGIFRL